MSVATAIKPAQPLQAADRTAIPTTPANGRSRRPRAMPT